MVTSVPVIFLITVAESISSPSISLAPAGRGLVNVDSFWAWLPEKQSLPCNFILSHLREKDTLSKVFTIFDKICDFLHTNALLKRHLPLFRREAETNMTDLPLL